ncbi:serine/arginine repetitive matrix protein 1-like isoform X2 [Melanaphis sacchari]|uniref:serine/arginine repetitive matrix protein 1-like isoform X2 n=1 Tax=Melanaphis sacchari TaxID=742174 RepID=UPI000DC12D96|nr:serine/arginine repetitive matrix protein 1-like isoform X2 [Melanaphis sacchari]
MDYNSIDEDDVEKLRLAALMTFKKKSNLPINAISSTSGEFNKFSNGNSYSNPARNNNRGRFPAAPNRQYNKRAYANVGFRRPTHANNNLIAIIPMDSEGDSLNDSISKNSPKNINSINTSTSDSTKLTNSQNLNNEVSTKFSRLDNESGSEESDNSEAEGDGKEDSDDGDVLLLGEEDEDLDDLDKLMDIMEAEIAGGDVKSSKKEKKNLKHKNKKDKGHLKNKLNAKIKIDEPPIFVNQPKIIENSKTQLNPPEEELESIKTLEEIRFSSSQSSLSKSRVPLRSPSPPIRKRSISPYSKRSPFSRSPRRRSPSIDRYRYSPPRSRLYRRSLSPRRSPRRMSPLREKNLSPRRYSPLKSRYSYRSPSPRRRRRSLSRDISPSRRRLSPLRRRSRSPLKIKSKSRSPKARPAIRRRSPSPLKKAIRSRPISPIRRKDSKSIDDDHLKKREKVKTIDNQMESKLVDPVLEARRRKFESNKPIEPTSKKIILKKSNSVQVAIQTESKETQNDKNESEIKPKTNHLTKKGKKVTHSFQVPKNINIKMNNDLENVHLRRVIKVNNSSDKICNKKRPRIVFENEEKNETLVEEADKFDQHVENIPKSNTTVTKVLHSEAVEVSSTSEEELSEEEISEEEVSEENVDEESEKEDGQDSSDSCEEFIEEEEEIEELSQEIDDKKESLQHNDTVDLRTELKRRRALRLNMIQVEVKKKPESFYPARLLQSAIRGVVGSSSNNEVKRKKHSKIPEISIKTESNSDGRRVIVMNRDNTRTDNVHEDYNEAVESYASVKRLKGKLKKAPVRLRTTGVNNDNINQKGLRKIIKRNINVTDFDQM